MRLANTTTVALVGGETLIGREIRDVLATAKTGLDLKLLAGGEEETGTLTEQAGEPAVINLLNAENLRGAGAVLLAGSAESSRKVLEMGIPGTLIDLTYTAEEHPRARVRAPIVETEGPHSAGSAVYVTAHPAAIALALFLNRLHPVHPIRRTVVHVFEPASERGKKGLEEMQQQTVSLLSFKGLPKAVFDAQVSFNMLARYGEEAAARLEDAELRIERHLATLLANSSHAPMPSLRLIQAPVFHGHSFSLWVEFEKNPGVPALEKALSSDPIDVRTADMEPPNNVGVAGQSGISVGAVTADRNHAAAAWFWMAADNLRLSAENAVALL
jgi:aspartate-semialdehyde dehydrogenase